MCYRCSIPAFQQAVDNAESSPESCGDKLKAFLIFPVQRAMRYPLLLREVERVTSDPQPLERVQMCLHHFEKVNPQVIYARDSERDWKSQRYAPVTLSRIHWRFSENAGDMCNTDVSANHGD